MSIGSGADTSLLDISYIDEDAQTGGSGTWGTIPTGNFQKLRVTGENLGSTKETGEVQELRSDRQVPDLVEFAKGAGGTLNGNLSYGVWDDFIEAVHASTWSAQVTNNPVNGEFINATSKITGTGIETGLQAGDVVRVVVDPASSANDGFYVVTATGTNEITVSPAPTDQGTADLDITVDTTRLGMGSLCRSFSIEKHFTDIAGGTDGKYVVHRGLVPGSYNLSINANGFLEINFEFLGRDSATGSTSFASTGLYDAAPTNDVVSASVGVGQVYENSAALTTALLSFGLGVNGNLRVKPQIGSKFPYGIGAGTFTTNGSISAYYVNATLLNRQLNHDASSMWFPVYDNTSSPTSGNAYAWNIHRLRFAEGGPRAQGPNGDVTQDLNYTGIYSSTTGYALSCFRFPSA